jgi:hypothetical protein
MSPSVLQNFFDLAAHFEAEGDVQLPAAKSAGFGSATLRCNGKIFAMCPDGQGLVVKLPAARVTELVAASLAEPYSKSTGKPMKEWGLIPAAQRDAWIARAEEALAYARSVSSAQPVSSRA